MKIEYKNLLLFSIIIFLGCNIFKYFYNYKELTENDIKKINSVLDDKFVNRKKLLELSELINNQQTANFTSPNGITLLIGLSKSDNSKMTNTDFIQSRINKMNNKQEEWVLFFEKLKKMGLDINRKGKYQKTALIWNTEVGLEKPFYLNKFNYELEKLLLKNGADPNITDIDGNTALMYASNANSFFYVKLLLENGASVNLMNIKGQKAIEVTDSLNIKNEILKYTK